MVTILDLPLGSYSPAFIGLVLVGCAQPLPDVGDDGTTMGASTGSGLVSSGTTESGALDTSSGRDTSSGGAEASAGSETSSGQSETTAGSETSISETSGTSAGIEPPQAPVLEMNFSQVKQFDFSWAAVAEAEFYQLLESPASGDPFGQIGGDLADMSVSISVPLHFRFEATYVLRACNAGGCTDSDPVAVMNSLVGAVGYFKASNTGMGDYFGCSMALSEDGNTLAVGAYREDSDATGIDGNPASDSASDAGAVYVFVRDGMGGWSQQAYIKASNTGGGSPGDEFGQSVALSGDGDTLAVGAVREASSATGIDGDQTDDSALDSGAVYVYVRDPMGQWVQQAYVKASNTGTGDEFGGSVALSGDGSTLVVGAPHEDSNAIGIGGIQGNDAISDSGAVYVFVRSGVGEWSQQAYVKASNTGPGDSFGRSVALSGDGNTLAIGAPWESSSAIGINGNQANDGALSSGSVYVFVRSGADVWSQQAYVKASNTDVNDLFGFSVALSGDGNTLAAGAHQESSAAAGVDGDQTNNNANDAGAVYVIVRNGAGAWSQQAYVKASNTEASDYFGRGVALSYDGSVLAAGAHGEDSDAIGLDGDDLNNVASYAGAAYVFVRDPLGQWAQYAYVKASDPDSNDRFGLNLALSADGSVLSIGSQYEDSSATGVSGDPTNDSVSSAGAVYLY